MIYNHIKYKAFSGIYQPSKGSSSSFKLLLFTATSQNSFRIAFGNGSLLFNSQIGKHVLKNAPYPSKGSSSSFKLLLFTATSQNSFRIAFGNGSLLFNSQIGKHVLKNAPYHRRRNGASIVNALGIMDNAQSKYLGIVCRSKTQKTGAAMVPP